MTYFEEFCEAAKTDPAKDRLLKAYQRSETWAVEKMYYATEAAGVWESMDKNQQTGIRFGLFPVEVMGLAKQLGYDQHKLCCALMDVAVQNGGMRA